MGSSARHGAGKIHRDEAAVRHVAARLRRDPARGTRCVWASPADAIARGIGMVHQHFMLAGPYSALDNILLGAEPVRRCVIERRAARRRLEALASQYGLPVEWDSPIEELPVGVQQRVEILKLLYRNAQILIRNEPTAVLTPQETKGLSRTSRSCAPRARRSSW